MKLLPAEEKRANFSIRFANEGEAKKADQIRDIQLSLIET